MILLQCKWQKSMHMSWDFFVCTMHEPEGLVHCDVKKSNFKYIIFYNLHINKIISVIKGPFLGPQSHPSNFSPRKLRFYHQQKPLGTYCLCAKYFLQIHLFGKIIGQIVYALLTLKYGVKIPTCIHKSRLYTYIP